MHPWELSHYTLKVKRARINQSASQELSDLRSQIGKLFVKWTPSHCLSLVQRSSVYLDLLSPRGQYYALCKLPTVQQIILTRDPAWSLPASDMQDRTMFPFVLVSEWSIILSPMSWRDMADKPNVAWDNDGFRCEKSPTLDQYAYIYVANMHAGRCHPRILSCASWLNLNFLRQGAVYKPASSYPTRHAVMSHCMRFNTRLIK